MKIAFTTKGTELNSQIDPRFGRSDFFIIYNTENKEFISIDNREVEQEAHGAGPKTAQKIIEHDVDVVITGNGPGNNAVSVLKIAEIDVYIGAAEMSVEEAYDAFINNNLSKMA